jgi:hypothetical protein
MFLPPTILQDWECLITNYKRPFQNSCAPRSDSSSVHMQGFDLDDDNSVLQPVLTDSSMSDETLTRHA